MTRTAPAGRTLRFITALSARLTCPKPNARPIRHNARVPDRNGKIFYTSITSLSHISKIAGNISTHIVKDGDDGSGNLLSLPVYISIPISNDGDDKCVQAIVEAVMGFQSTSPMTAMTPAPYTACAG